jgi:hypothetical protein
MSSIDMPETPDDRDRDHDYERAGAIEMFHFLCEEADDLEQAAWHLHGFRVDPEAGRLISDELARVAGAIRELANRSFPEVAAAPPPSSS